MLLAIYIVPSIYTYFRLLMLLNRRYSRVIFSFFYLILIAAFPVAEIISHRSDDGWVKYIILAGYYMLPFFLYLFLSVLSLDLFRGLNRLVQVLPAEVFKRPKFRINAFWCFFILSLLIVIIGIIHHHTIRVSYYTVDIPRGNSSLNNLKIVMAADFHLGLTTGKGFLEIVSAKINSLHPDIVLLPGDIREGHSNDGDLEEYIRCFRQIESKYGIFASPGNHEGHGGENLLPFFHQAGIQLLADEYRVIDNSFSLVGRKDHRSRDRKTLPQILGNLPVHLPVIVMDHRPINLDKISKYKVDMQVSGHTHYGQLFPLNLLINYIYELGWGYQKIGNTHFFVTSGIQVWGPPVRTAGNSEIMFIRVNFI